MGCMAIDSDKVNQSITKGNVAIVLHAWKDHLWSIGSKGEPPRPCPRQQWVTRVVDGGSADGGSDVGTDAPPGSGKDAVGISLLAWRMGSWQVPRRTPHRKVASLVNVYSSDAELIITRGICSSTSGTLASCTNDSR